MDGEFTSKQIDAIFYFMESPKPGMARKGEFGKMLEKIQEEGFEMFICKLADRNMNGKIERGEIKTVEKQLGC